MSKLVITSCISYYVTVQLRLQFFGANTADDTETFDFRAIGVRTFALVYILFLSSVLARDP